ncbi:protein kinase [Cordyceps militaris CM01]|uniref:non-specific serine/threonine protein kinase n=1 Tax=Cordyceps militaris (strain CM01) TaxID=983644 RepID=G3J877_CORMM|nr:protein kinase [Cordyceps militaris CM01]EGX94716.1 protein kinase [Cordyceps militaris CM01]
MGDTNIIARLYAWPPHNRLAEEAIKRSGFAVSPLHESSIAPPFGRTEGLVTPINPSAGITLDQSLNPHIRISFNHVPKTSHGLVFGCGKQCDVVLPDERSISAHHFSITFDEQYRLIVRDLNSTAGTEVIFGKDVGHISAKFPRRNFQWLVEGSCRMPSSKVVIRVGLKLSFYLVPETQSMPQTEYKMKVDNFRQGSGTAQALFASINTRLQCQPQPVVGAIASKQDPIYQEMVIGKGAFGRAKYMWNVSTGEEMVLKEPINESTISPAWLQRWKEEAYTMRKLHHENILKLLHDEFWPRPQLFLEYCPGGPLTGIAHELSAVEILQVLQQSLAGLQYAHKIGIAHRDLKLDNILVASRSPLKIKLADFGIAKSDAQLQSVCGTPPFMALDIWAMEYPDKARYYTKLVDIWALGVVIYHLLFGVPVGYGPELCVKIVRDLRTYLQTNRGTIAEFLAKYMLRLQEVDRSSAAACYRGAMALPTPNDEIRGSTKASADCNSTAEDTLSETNLLDWLQGSTRPGTRKRAAGDARTSECRSQPRKRNISTKQRDDNSSGCGGSTSKLCSISDEEWNLTQLPTEQSTVTQTDLSGLFW